MSLSAAEFAQKLASLRPRLLAQACRTRPCGKEDGEDIVAETIRLALTLLPETDLAPEDADLLRWLRAILKRVVLQHRQRARRTVPTDSLEDAFSIVGPGDNRAWQERLQPALEALPSGLHAVVHYRLDGYTPAQIARLLRIHRNTVANRLEAARRIFQTVLPDYSPERDGSLFQECAQVAIYRKPQNVWTPWSRQHPEEVDWKAYLRERGSQTANAPCKPGPNSEKSE